MENINVFVRIKPRLNLKDDDHIWKTDGNSIQNLKTKEYFNFGNLFSNFNDIILDQIIDTNHNNEDVFKLIMKDSLDSLLNGINISVFAYGQTSTGKTFTMKGTNTCLDGIIPLSVKDIFTKLSDGSVSKYSMKVSYLEIYNETVNDLLDINKKNLEIRESLQKGVFVNNLTEVIVPGYDKVIQLLKQGESNRVIAETRLNEKSSRSHTIFRINLELTKTLEGKTKIFLSQVNLIDLAGSENVSRAKTEGIRMKEGSNINKSLLALSNVINKLSSNAKNFVNYRDSKLTRLLQPALSGNSRTMIICTLSDTISSYSETLNTLHFGTKAKNIKTTIRVNELMDEKSKMIQENSQLKNKIKQLEDLITEKRISEGQQTSLKSSSDHADDKMKNPLNTSQSDAIATLEKEVSLLKRILISNEEIGEECMSQTNEIRSTHSGNLYNNLMNNCASNSNSSYVNPRDHSLLQSGYKHSNTYNRFPLMSSEKKMTDSARKICGGYSLTNNNNNNNLFNEPEVMQTSNTSSIFRRCMTDMKSSIFAQGIYPQQGAGNGYNMPMPMTSNNYIQNSVTKNKLMMSNYKPVENEMDFLYPSSSDSFQLMKENEELRKSLYEIRKTYYDVVQSKENQIKSLNMNHSLTLENCEKLIREAEENYINLKLSFDRAKEDLLNKDNEIKTYITKSLNQEASINFYKEEICRLNQDLSKVKDSSSQDGFFKEMEKKLAISQEKYDKMKENYENDKQNFNELKSIHDKLRNENNFIKTQLENHKTENMSFKTQYDVMKKNNDLLINENQKFKNDIDSYKNEIAGHKDKLNKMKNEIAALSKGKKKEHVNSEEYENKITSQNATIAQLEAQVNEYKNTITRIEQTQIAEYQKLLDESFEKINELNRELNFCNEKVKYLEKAFKYAECAKSEMRAVRESPLRDITMGNSANTQRKAGPQISQFSFCDEKSLFESVSIGIPGLKEESTGKDITSSNPKEFINKKRKYLSKIYQNMIDNNLNTKEESMNKTPQTKQEILPIFKEEKENVKDSNYFSTYEV